MPNTNNSDVKIKGTDRSPPKAGERILAAARDLFYRNGIRAIGVDEIVRKAGVTKPSLYRNFCSKDALAAAYLEVYDREFWHRFDEALANHPGEPRQQIRAFLTRVAERTATPGYRGCGMTNAAVEYPEKRHPARLVGEENKRELRRRLRLLAAQMGAKEPDILGDGLLLLIEGAYISSQLFGPGGPAASVVENADRLIEASL